LFVPMWLDQSLKHGSPPEAAPGDELPALPLDLRDFQLQQEKRLLQRSLEQAKYQYVDGITSDSESEGGGGGFDGGEELDPLFDQAVNFVTEKRK
ncbi:hypothetical protein FK513_30090, partial [Klebsiella pneumoniae]|nr:hypothetical protein [Klebsiella pneumoniae]